MNSNHWVWNRFTEGEQNDLVNLLIRRKRIAAIKYARGAAGLGLTEARDFIDSAWLCQKVADFDPTRMSAKDEFKSKILRVLTDAKYYIDDTEMKVEEKYEFITANHIVELFEICRED